MGPNKYLLYTAFRRDLTINTICSKYNSAKKSLPVKTEIKSNSSTADGDGNDGDQECNSDEMIKSSYVLTLSQLPVKMDTSADESIFEPLSQVSY